LNREASFDGRALLAGVTRALDISKVRNLGRWNKNHGTKANNACVFDDRSLLQVQLVFLIAIHGSGPHYITMAPQTRHAGQESTKQKLKFHEKLIGKGLATDAMLKKMKSLHTELAALDQEVVDVNSLGTVRKELINTSVLLHKDRGVKAYAACCLADILRLYAPDAPYTQSELRDIFQFFFRQLSTGLKGADSSYYNEYFHLLESLSTVKSVVLVCDLPTAEEHMVEIFRDFFILVKRDLAKKIEMFMVDILVALIDECQVLPTEVLETILSQFMDKNTVCPSHCLMLFI
jgi:sister-chromatid-cohesion protein PDS5